MSDQSQGPGWWLASDGKWYPPQPPAAQPVAPMRPPMAPMSPPKKAMSTGVKVLIALGVAMVLLVGGCVAVFVVAGRSVSDSLSENEAKVVGRSPNGDTPDSAGGRKSPLPVGTEVDLGNGWKVKVTSATVDGAKALDVVRKANEFNTDPEPGKRYILVDLLATFTGPADATAPDLQAPMTSLSLSVFGSAGVEHSILDGPSIVLNDLTSWSAELAEGASAKLTQVFVVGADETDLVLRAKPLFSLDNTEAWLALS